MPRLDPLGFGLALDEGDIALGPDGPGGSLVPALVVGRKNLLQALRLRILTPYGTDLMNARYGLDVKDAFTGSAPVAMARELVRLSLIRALATDPRVSEVTSVAFPGDPEFTGPINPGADPARRSRAWDVEIRLTTVDRGAETVRLAIGTTPS